MEKKGGGTPFLWVEELVQDGVSETFSLLAGVSVQHTTCATVQTSLHLGRRWVGGGHLVGSGRK